MKEQQQTKCNYTKESWETHKPKWKPYILNYFMNKRKSPIMSAGLSSLIAAAAFVSCISM